MLLIGHSLADSSLKNYLRLNRDKSPANHHYMIFWLGDAEVYSKSRQQDVFDANLELYNLITIFLKTSEIKEFIGLLNQDERGFRETLDMLGDDRRSRYDYYIVGPVAAGKSTLLEQLRCFKTHEEWTRPPPRELYLASSNINDEQKLVVDQFIFSELKEKNRRMCADSIGFQFMDRAPLDLYAFTGSPSEDKEKSRRIRDLVTRDQALHKGEILFIEAPPSTLVRRNLSRGRPPEEAGAEDYFQTQTAKLKDVYNPSFILCTEPHNAGEVASRIARHVLLGDYNPCDVDGIISRYE